MPPKLSSPWIFTVGNSPEKWPHRAHLVKGLLSLCLHGPHFKLCEEQQHRHRSRRHIGNFQSGCKFHTENEVSWPVESCVPTPFPLVELTLWFQSLGWCHGSDFDHPPNSGFSFYSFSFGSRLANRRAWRNLSDRVRKQVSFLVLISPSLTKTSLFFILINSLPRARNVFLAFVTQYCLSNSTTNNLVLSSRYQSRDFSLLFSPELPRP